MSDFIGGDYVKQVKLVDTEWDTKMYIDEEYAGDISRMTNEEVLEVLANFDVINVEKIYK